MERTDFSQVTACGECCAGGEKKLDGRCRGCRETDGHCEEWSQSGRCPIHACVQEHGVAFCGVCPLFPCADLEQKIPWNPRIVEHLTALAGKFRQGKHGG